MSVFQILSNKLIAHQAHAFQCFIRLRNQGFPIRRGRVEHINRNNFPTRGVLVRPEIEQRTLVVNEGVIGVEFAHKVLRRTGIAFVKILEKQAIFVVRTLANRDEQESAVVRLCGTGSPILVFELFPDQRIFRLRCSKSMEVNFLEVVRLRQILASLGLWIATIIEAVALFVPGGT